jgi:hypothetical protein
MPKTLSELIADAASADDLAFTGPDGVTFKLSDIRGFRSGVDTETANAKKLRLEAEKNANEAATILATLQEAAKKMNENPSGVVKKDETPDWRKDPLYQPLLPVFDALEAKATAFADRAEKLAKTLEGSQAIYAVERLRRQWAEATVKPKDKAFEDVVKEIIAAKEVDEFGLPTMQRYLHRVTEPDRIKAAADTAVAAAKVEWDKQAKVAAIPKPGQFRPRGKAAEAPIKNLGELTSEVIANDPDIAAAMEGGLQN